MSLQAVDKGSYNQFQFCYQSTIALFVDKRILQDISPLESVPHLMSRRGLQLASLIAGFGGRIPFVAMNFDLSGRNIVYGILLSYGTCASFGYLLSYALLEIVKSQMQPLTPEQRILMESRMTPLIKKVFFAVATILGFSTQVPFAYLAYEYNKDSTGFFMPLMVFSIDSWVSTYSGYMGLKTIRERQSFSSYEKDLSRLRKEICNLIEENLELLTFIETSEKLQFLSSYEKIKLITNDEDRVKNLYELFTARISYGHTKSLSKTDKVIKYVARTYGYLCTACNIGTFGYISWHGTHALTNSSLLSATLTVLCSGTTIYLNASAMPETAVKLATLFKSIFTLSYQPTLVDQFTPKLSFSVKALGIVTATLSYGPLVEISKKYYASEGYLENIMEITLSCSAVFLVLMAIFSINDQLLEGKIEKLGSEEEKKIMQLYKKMHLLSSTLSESPLIEVARFLKILNPSSLEEIIQKTEISLSNLEEYIESHGISHQEKIKLLV